MGVSWSPCPLLLADLESVPIDAESDVVIHSSWQLVVPLMEEEDGVIHSSWQLVIPLMEGQDGDGGENNVKTELALFSFWLVFILSCYQCCVQSRTVSMLNGAHQTQHREHFKNIDLIQIISKES